MANTSYSCCRHLFFKIFKSSVAPLIGSLTAYVNAHASNWIRVLLYEQPLCLNTQALLQFYNGHQHSDYKSKFNCCTIVFPPRGKKGNCQSHHLAITPGGDLLQHKMLSWWLQPLCYSVSGQSETQLSKLFNFLCFLIILTYLCANVLEKSLSM